MEEKFSLYSHDLWERFCEKYGKSEAKFELKTYPQFDPFFNFFERKTEIQELVSDPALKKVSTHSFLPFVKILTKTPRYKYQENENCYELETKIRPISFASHFDTYLYGFYSFALTEKYQDFIKEHSFSESILAYRTDLDGKGNIQFAKEVFDIIKLRIQNEGSCAALALDIKGYFDNIDHFKLKEKWCNVIGLSELPTDQYKVFKSLTSYSYVSKDSLLKHFNISLIKKRKKDEKWQSLLDLIPDELAGSSFKEKFELLKKRKLIVKNPPKKLKSGDLEFRGIPQGSSMSAVLSNIYLIDFDKWLFELGTENSFTYRRYCDDILIICKPEQAESIRNLVVEKIASYHLTIQNSKTEYVEFIKNSKGKIRSFNKKKIIEENAVLNPGNEQRYYKNLQYLGFEFNGQNIYIRPVSLSRYFRKMKGRIVKSIMMAYSDKSKIDKILKRQINYKYSHLGKRNFISYALNASKSVYKTTSGKAKEGLSSTSIKRQIEAHIRILKHEIIKTTEQRAIQKAKRKKKEIKVKY